MGNLARTSRLTRTLIALVCAITISISAHRVAHAAGLTPDYSARITGWGQVVAGAYFSGGTAYPDALHLDVNGNLLVNASGGTGTGAGQVQGTAAQGATIAGNPLLLGGTFTTSPATITTGQTATLQTDAVQSLLIAGNGPVGAGAAATKSLLGGLVFNTALPAPTNGQQVAFQGDGSGALIVGGHVANAATDAGNPLKIGGKATLLGGDSVVTALQRVDGSFDLTGALRIVPAIPQSSWSITNAAAVNNVATATQAAGAAGVKHACYGFQASLWQDNTGTVSAAAGFTVAVRDGASGAGTVKWSKTFSFPVATNGAGQEVNVVFPVPIVGTAATAMCVEFTSSALLHTGCTVNAQGYDTK